MEKGENDMLFILTGVVSFLLLFMFDYYTLKNKSLKKKIFGLAGVSLFIYSTVMIMVTSKKISFPITLRILSGVFFGVFTFLLIYSLFIELPFKKTYGKVQYNNELIDTGTYALCRHPGVLWFGLLFFFAFFMTGATLIIYAVIIWTGVDIVYVCLQEKIFFFKIFPKYKTYVSTTPMLVPTRESIKKCISTLL